MLDAYIIEKIRREELRREERPRIQLEVPYWDAPARYPPPATPEVERGVVVIPLVPNSGCEEDAA